MALQSALIPLAAWSTWHTVALVVVVLVLFGGKKLPELARGLARGMRIFKDELHGIQKDLEESPAPSQPSQTSTTPAAPTATPTAPAPTEEKK